ncbi:hypothetical protein JYT31_02465, partial [Beggiatoa alba]|nr:hypothetical protein [Beggiatoa alba]
EQKAQIVLSEQQCQQSKLIWQDVHRKSEIMNITVNRFKMKERYDEEHREQKEMDDRPYKQPIDLK